MLKTGGGVVVKLCLGMYLYLDKIFHYPQLTSNSKKPPKEKNDESWNKEWMHSKVMINWVK